MKLEVDQIERELAALIAEYPELADDEDLRAGMVEGSTEAMAVLERIAVTMLEAEANAAAAGALAKKYSERKARLERRKEAMRTLAMRVLKAADRRKAELGCATLSRRAAGSSVVITDEDAIPDEFWKIEREPKKAEIKKALKDGKFIPGAVLSNGGETLTVSVA